MTTSQAASQVASAVESAPSDLTGFHISVHVGFWNGKKSNDKREYRNGKGKEIQAKTAPVQSYIIDMDHLNPVLNLSQKIRKNLDSPLHSLQIQYEGNVEGAGVGQGRRIKSRIIPRHRLVAWFKRHNDLVEQFNAAVKTFINNYADSIEKAKPALEADNIFNEDDYPEADKLAGKFYVEVDIRPANWDIDLSQSIGDIAAEADKSEAEVLHQLIEQESLKHAQRVNSMGDKLCAALASNLEDAFDGMVKILRAKAEGERTRLTLHRVSDFIEFFNAVKSLNVADNPQLNRVAQNVLDKLEAEGLTDPEDFIAGVQASASEVVEALDENLAEVRDVCGELTRKIVF